MFRCLSSFLLVSSILLGSLDSAAAGETPPKEPEDHLKELMTVYEGNRFEVHATPMLLTPSGLFTDVLNLCLTDPTCDAPTVRFVPYVERWRGKGLGLDMSQSGLLSDCLDHIVPPAFLRDFCYHQPVVFDLYAKDVPLLTVLRALKEIRYGWDDPGKKATVNVHIALPSSWLAWLRIM